MPDRYINDEQKEDFFYDVFQTLKEHQYIKCFSDVLPWPKTEGCFATKPNTVVISTDGSLHSCVQEFSSLTPYDDDKFKNFLDSNSFCEKCKYFPICLGGCIHNRSLKNTVRTPCVRNRFIIRPLLKLIASDQLYDALCEVQNEI